MWVVFVNHSQASLNFMHQICVGGGDISVSGNETMNTTSLKQWVLLLLEEILHRFIGSLPYYLQGFIHPRWLAALEDAGHGFTIAFQWLQPWILQFFFAMLYFKYIQLVGQIKYNMYTNPPDITLEKSTIAKLSQSAFFRGYDEFRGNITRWWFKYCLCLPLHGEMIQ